MQDPPLQLLASPLDCQDSLPAGRLRALGELGDLVGGSSRTLGEAAHLVRDHSKATAGLARAGGLNCRIEREQGCLVRDVLEKLENVLDFVDAPCVGLRAVT